MPWTPEREQILRQMWAEGVSSSRIASALGFTSRGPVVGKAKRLGLPHRDVGEQTRAYYTRLRAEGRIATKRQRKPSTEPKAKSLPKRRGAPPNFRSSAKPPASVFGSEAASRAAEALLRAAASAEARRDQFRSTGWAR